MVHQEWQPIVDKACAAMDASYLKIIQDDHQDLLPIQSHVFRAFEKPLSETDIILFGESPYPRAGSANGYAFWDAAVEALWSNQGLSKTVNRATSLRNIMKMLLYARGDLTTDFSKDAVAQLDTSQYPQTGDALFQKLLDKGFMLLNASLIYEKGRVQFHAKHWQPFMQVLLEELHHHKPSLKLLLFGKVAEKLDGYQRFPHLCAEHPYNLSFITNRDVVAFFEPLDVLGGA